MTVSACAIFVVHEFASNGMNLIRRLIILLRTSVTVTLVCCAMKRHRWLMQPFLLTESRFIGTLRENGSVKILLWLSNGWLGPQHTGKVLATLFMSDRIPAPIGGNSSEFYKRI